MIRACVHTPSTYGSSHGGHHVERFDDDIMLSDFVMTDCMFLSTHGSSHGGCMFSESMTFSV